MEQVRHYGKGREPPKGARLMTDDEVYRTLSKQIQDWDPPSRMWALKHGTVVPVFVASMSAAYINYRFRRYFKLKDLAQLATYFPTVVLPSATSACANYYTTTDIILQKTPCPSCVQARSICMHAFLGVIYPIIIAPIACASFAVRRYTIKIKDVKDFAQQVVNFVRKKPNSYMFLLALNAAVAFGITYRQQHAAMNLHLKARTEPLQVVGQFEL